VVCIQTTPSSEPFQKKIPSSESFQSKKKKKKKKKEKKRKKKHPTNTRSNRTVAAATEETGLIRLCLIVFTFSYATASIQHLICLSSKHSTSYMHICERKSLSIRKCSAFLASI